MKYESKQISTAHGTPTRYTLVVGLEEIRLLKAIVATAQKYTPETTENTIMCRRLQNMKKTLNAIKLP